MGFSTVAEGGGGGGSAVPRSLGQGLPAGYEQVLLYSYDYDARTWKQAHLGARIDKQPFQKGSCRMAFRMWDTAGKPFVVKTHLGSSPPGPEVYFADAAMQAMCQYFAICYNKRSPPKPVRFVTAYILRCLQRPGQPVMACERFLEGSYVKYNNNAGYISPDDRNTPQAFSHFTHVFSKGKAMVVDIQGTEMDVYTDPQVHSPDFRYGAGDLGLDGIRLFFASHKCSSICVGLGLSKQQTDFENTQMAVAAPTPVPTLVRAPQRRATGGSSSGAGALSQNWDPVAGPRSGGSGGNIAGVAMICV